MKCVENTMSDLSPIIRELCKVAPLPTTIVEIQPAWRGFLYFVVGEQIVIVDPDDHEIVAVIAA